MPPDAAPAPPVTLAHYDESSYQETQIALEEVCPAAPDTTGVTWISVAGSGDPALADCLGRQLNLHPLLVHRLETGEQRPTFQDFGDYLFIALRVLTHDPQASDVAGEQIGLLVSDRLVLTFEESAPAAFAVVRERLRTGAGRVRKLGADYLAYALMDEVVDGYFDVLEQIGEDIESAEEELLGEAGPTLLPEIYRLKRETLAVRRAVWPFREVLNTLARGESPLIREETLVYFRDLYEHTVEVIETVETLRDTLSSMLDLYLSSVSNHLNSIMKVLTIFATVFAPLTFLVGVYGMNFKYMPELNKPWAYPAVLGLSAVIAGTMLVWFRKKGWL
jgi:magnesium transporter